MASVIVDTVRMWRDVKELPRTELVPSVASFNRVRLPPDNETDTSVAVDDSSNKICDSVPCANSAVPSEIVLPLSNLSAVRDPSYSVPTPSAAKRRSVSCPAFMDAFAVSDNVNDLTSDRLVSDPEVAEATPSRNVSLENTARAVRAPPRSVAVPSCANFNLVNEPVDSSNDKPLPLLSVTVAALTLVKPVHSPPVHVPVPASESVSERKTFRDVKLPVCHVCNRAKDVKLPLASEAVPSVADVTVLTRVKFVNDPAFIEPCPSLSS